MTIGLGIVSIVIGFVGALIVALVLRGDSFGMGALGLALGGIIIGYPIGVIIGINLNPWSREVIYPTLSI